MKKFTFIAVVALLAIFIAGPSMAATKVGGIVFTEAYWWHQDEKSASGGIASGGTQTAGKFDRFIIAIAPHTRLNAEWTNEDNVGLFIELGLGGGSATAARGAISGSSAVTMRHAYGWWDITPNFRLMAGHSTTPFSPLEPDQLLGFSTGNVNIIMNGYGNFYSGRFVQVRGSFKYPNNMGHLDIALVDPNGGAATLPAGAAANDTITDQTTLPRIDVGSPLYFSNIKIYPSFFYQKVNIEGTASGVPNDYNVYGGSLGAKVDYGPFDFSGEFIYGKNWGNTYGSVGAGINPAPANDQVRFLDANGDGIDDSSEDTDCTAWWIDIGFKFGPAKPQIIVGQYHVKNDGLAAVATDDIDITTTGYVFTLPIDLAKGFRIRPEFGYYDDDSGAKMGTAATQNVDNGIYTIAGVQFQITF